jgi:hypothetical protein
MYAAIITRLKTVSQLKTVGGSVDFGGIESAPKALNAAYVLPSTDKSARNALASGGVEQHSILRFSVVICVHNIKTLAGESSMGDLIVVRPAIDAALLGWEPLAGYDAIEHDNGRLMKIGNGVMWWMDEYLTGYFRRK